MENLKNDILSQTAAYYSEKLATYGMNHRGVDWNSEAGQIQRFDQLGKLMSADHVFSIADIGCGYAAFYDYAKERFPDFVYHGVDIASNMVDAARQRIGSEPNVILEVGSEPSVPVDYAIASGILNVRFGRPLDDWKDFVRSVLDMMHRVSRRGFAFNCLTSYSDPDRMVENLFYSDPLELFDLCKRRYSRHVALLHDYGLYEFTLIVRKVIV